MSFVCVYLGRSTTALSHLFLSSFYRHKKEKKRDKERERNSDKDRSREEPERSASKKKKSKDKERERERKSDGEKGDIKVGKVSWTLLIPTHCELCFVDRLREVFIHFKYLIQWFPFTDHQGLWWRRTRLRQWEGAWGQEGFWRLCCVSSVSRR